MSRKSTVNTADGFVIEPGAYQRMTGAMMELAMRNAETEATVMRIAKAGGINDVMKQLTRLRVYAKKQGLVRAGREPRTAGAPSLVHSGGRRKAKKKGKGSAAGSEGEAA